MSLTALKHRWFINFPESRVTFPPSSRHPGSTVGHSTDGNLVTPIIDSQAYMEYWHDLIGSLARNRLGEIYHASFMIDNVRTLGHASPGSEAVATLIAAHRNNVTVRVLISMHLQGFGINLGELQQLTMQGVQSFGDERYPAFSGCHQKFTILKGATEAWALLGSIDIFSGRWDDQQHLPTNPNRPPGVRLTHELGVMIQGPAVRHVEECFRERWNDRTQVEFIGAPGPRPRRAPIRLTITTQPIQTPLADPPPNPSRTHSVQVLRTYGRIQSGSRHSWSREGEFTVWAAYLNAIRVSQRYIYIEDQFFTPFTLADGTPCYYASTSRTQHSDLFYALGEAIRNNVKVAVLIPLNTEEPTQWIRTMQRYYRDLGIFYLSNIAAAERARGRSGDFVVAYAHNGAAPFFIHSKVMICDDEYVGVGSANFAQRSMSCDTELHVGVVDGENNFARDLRKLLWAHHLVRPASTLHDWFSAFHTFKDDTIHGNGRVRPYPTVHPGLPPVAINQLRNIAIDPYAGPPRS